MSLRSAGGVFFEDRGTSIIGDDAHLANIPNRPPHMQGAVQSSKNRQGPVRLMANCFKLTMLPQGSIYQIAYELKPPAKTVREERWVLQKLWTRLQEELGVFVVHFPGGYFFCPKPLEKELSLDVVEDTGLGYPAHTVSVKAEKIISADAINEGVCGPAQVVLQHVAKRLAEGMRYQKVGRRYYHNDDLLDGKGPGELAVCAGFEMAAQTGKVGPHLVVNTTFRGFHRKENVIQTMHKYYIGESADEAESKLEWERRCTGATVVTLYNGRIYRVKGVRYDKKVDDEFDMFDKNEKVLKKVTFVLYYKYFYDSEIKDKSQPMFEAYAEKESEKVFLVPELCALTGTSSELRPDMSKEDAARTLDAIKARPGGRLSGIKEIVQKMSERGDGGAGAPAGAQVLKEWQMELDTNPTQVPAQIFPALEVDLGKNRFEIEDGGTFQRFMRNGVQASAAITDWLLIFPPADEPVADIWTRSLKDIAEVAFEMKFEFPTKLVCNNQLTDLVPLLQSKVTPATQLVLLLSPAPQATKVYKLVKAACSTSLPVMTQVVKTETMRRRQQIASVLSCIALQVNAKCCGPLWQIQLDHELTKPFFLPSSATMVVGIDVYNPLTGPKWFGFAASLDTHCSEYYSWASDLAGDAGDQGRPKSFRTVLSVKLQQAMASALQHFADRNNKVLPSNILVYRTSVRLSEEEAVRATEIEAILEVLRATKGESTKKGNNYDPRLTYVAITNSEGMRFFVQPPPNTSAGDNRAPKQENPEPGTVIDSPVVSRSSSLNFWMINQAASKEKGTVVPTHYTVWYDTANAPPTSLQNLTYRLSFMYFNIWMSVRLPAPAQYAKKIAHFIGKYVQAEPHERLLRTFFYL